MQIKHREKAVAYILRLPFNIWLSVKAEFEQAFY